jgi:VRR-NUC domain
MTMTSIYHQRPEQQVHRAVVQHLRQRDVPGVVFLHVPNGGKRKPIEAAIFKSLGVRAGASDLLLWHDRKSFALELKAQGGRATEDQRQFLADMEKAGAFTCLAEGLTSALATLEKWGLLRGVAA